MSRFAVGDTRVAYVSGAVHVAHPLGELLVEAVPGSFPGLSAVILTSGRIRSVGGLLALYAALEPHRAGRPLTVHALLGEERVFAITDVWTRLWPRGFPVDLDARRPSTFELPPFGVTTQELVTGEVQGGEVVPMPGLGVRIRTPDLTLAFVPAARPGTGVERLCSGVELAIVEVGRLDWPKTAHPFRATVDQASALAAGAEALWIVGDDGTWLGEEA